MVVMSLLAGLLLTSFSIITLLLIPLGASDKNASQKRADVRLKIRRDFSQAREGGLLRDYFRFFASSVKRLAEVGVYDLFVRFTIGVIVGSILIYISIVALQLFATTGSFRTLNPFDNRSVFVPPTPFSFFMDRWPFVLASILGILLMFSIIVGKVTEKTLKRSGQVIYVVAMVGLSAAMMGPLFDHVLRSTRYGGGIEVEIKLADGKDFRTANLFLTLSNTFTIWLPSTKKFLQIDATSISALRYDQNPDYALPNQKSFRDIFARGLFEKRRTADVIENEKMAIALDEAMSSVSDLDRIEYVPDTAKEEAAIVASRHLTEALESAPVELLTEEDRQLVEKKVKEIIAKMGDADQTEEGKELMESMETLYGDWRIEDREGNSKN